MIRVGIIGFGYMGHFHLKKVLSCRDARVCAVFDTDEEKRALAEEEGIQAFAGLEEFLRSDIDLVVIATPNQWHAPYAVAAMEAGKDVLCEKPAVLSVRELDEVSECSRRTGKFFTVHQQRRWDPDYRAVCDVVRSGEIGHVTTIESRVFGERGVCFGWRADPESGGGMLYDWGVHLIDQILMLFEPLKVKSVYARILSVLTPAVDDFFEITMLLENGVCARVAVTTFALQKMPRWFVFGDRGTMKLNDFSGVVGGAARIREQVQGFDSVVGQKDLGPSRFTRICWRHCRFQRKRICRWNSGTICSGLPGGKKNPMSGWNRFTGRCGLWKPPSSPRGRTGLWRRRSEKTAPSLTGYGKETL